MALALETHYKIPQVEEILKEAGFDCSDRSIRRCIADKELKSVKRFGKVYVSESSLKSFVEGEDQWRERKSSNDGLETKDTGSPADQAEKSGTSPGTMNKKDAQIALQRILNNSTKPKSS